ncbi:hypothetical protein [Maridesulfovibrio bastinii]|uniref:hypothetical protein n=1 Tax=Maridesulfovibrio bastinii TaxID=47157 RepID=UPI00040664C2|nr:hypothetical protein [Maridesulfovibrio bastinii]
MEGQAATEQQMSTASESATESTAVESVSPDTEIVSDFPSEESVSSSEDAWWAEEEISDAELRGESEPNPDESGTNEPDPSRPSDDEGGDKQESEKDDKADKDDSGADGEDDPEPKDGEGDESVGGERTVPLKALQEERRKRQEAQSRLSDLEAQIAKRQSFDPVEPLKGQIQRVAIPEHLQPDVDEFMEAFPAYAEMVTEDSPEGKALRSRLEDYGPTFAADYARGVTLERKIEQTQQSEEVYYQRQYLDACVAEMNNMFPEKSAAGETALEAVAFAEDRGLPTKTIHLLTNPGTMLIDPDTGKAVPLGRRAVDITSFIKDAFDSHKATDVEAMRASVEAELEEAITAKVTKQLTDKFRGGPQGSEFRGLGDAPGSAEQPGGTRTLSEAEVAKLSDAEYEKYLKGE